MGVKGLGEVMVCWGCSGGTPTWNTYQRKDVCMPLTWISEWESEWVVLVGQLGGKAGFI